MAKSLSTPYVCEYVFHSFTLMLTLISSVLRNNCYKPVATRIIHDIELIPIWYIGQTLVSPTGDWTNSASYILSSCLKSVSRLICCIACILLISINYVWLFLMNWVRHRKTTGEGEEEKKSRGARKPSCNTSMSLKRSTLGIFSAILCCKFWKINAYI